MDLSESLTEEPVSTPCPTTLLLRVVAVLGRVRSRSSAPMDPGAYDMRPDALLGRVLDEDILDCADRGLDPIHGGIGLGLGVDQRSILQRLKDFKIKVKMTIKANESLTFGEGVPFFLLESS